MPDLTHVYLVTPVRHLPSLFDRVRHALADPFELLHRINWSAPWLERKCEWPRGE